MKNELIIKEINSHTQGKTTKLCIMTFELINNDYTVRRIVEDLKREIDLAVQGDYNETY